MTFPNIFAPLGKVMEKSGKVVGVPGNVWESRGNVWESRGNIMGNFGKSGKVGAYLEAEWLEIMNKVGGA